MYLKIIFLGIRKKDLKFQKDKKSNKHILHKLKSKFIHFIREKSNFNFLKVKIKKFVNEIEIKIH